VSDKQHAFLATVATAKEARTDVDTAVQKPKVERHQSGAPPESESSARKRAKRALHATPWEGNAGGWPITARGPPEPPEIWRLERVVDATGLSRTAIYTLMAAGRFPRPISIHPGSRAWILSRIQARDLEATA
jgi:predicted DNA-binding transcriptional regulator AlpA